MADEQIELGVIEAPSGEVVTQYKDTVRTGSSHSASGLPKIDPARAKAEFEKALNEATEASRCTIRGTGRDLMMRGSAQEPTTITVTALGKGSTDRAKTDLEKLALIRGMLVPRDNIKCDPVRRGPVS